MLYRCVVFCANFFCNVIWKDLQKARYIEYYKVAHYCVFLKSKQVICLLEGWVRQKTVYKCKHTYFIPQLVQLIFEGLNINNQQCTTFTSMYLGKKGY